MFLCSTSVGDMAASKRVKETAHYGNEESEPSVKLASFEDGSEEWESTNHKVEIFDAFSRLKLENEVCDFVIEIEGEEINVHCAFLTASSKYYAAMFRHDMLEKTKGRVEIKNIKFWAGKQCIDFIYTGKVKFSLKSPEELIHAAELMAIPSLTDMFFQFLKRKVSTGECLKYMQLAETFGRKSFANFFRKFSIENFTEIIQTDDFTTISPSLLQQCLESLKKSDQTIEQQKWEAISKWVNADIKNRKDKFLEFFKLLKLEYLDNKFLKEKVLKEPLTNESHECKEMILNALLQPNPLKVADQTRSTAAYTKPTHIVMCSPGDTLYQWDLSNRQWSRILRLPKQMLQRCTDIVSVHGKLYLTSGDAIYTIRDNKLESLSSLYCELDYHRCIAHKHLIYIIRAQGSVLKYDTLQNSLVHLSAHLSLGPGFFVASSDECIFAMGGAKTGKLAREFDFQNETWYPITSMSYERSYGAAAFLDSKLYALGGNKRYGTIEAYNKDSNMWNNIKYSNTLDSGPKCYHYKFKAFEIFGQLFVIGGVWNASKDLLASKDSSPITIFDIANKISGVRSSMKFDNDISCLVYGN